VGWVSWEWLGVAFELGGGFAGIAEGCGEHIVMGYEIWRWLALWRCCELLADVDVLAVANWRTEASYSMDLLTLHSIKTSLHTYLTRIAMRPCLPYRSDSFNSFAHGRTGSPAPSGVKKGAHVIRRLHTYLSRSIAPSRHSPPRRSP